FDELGRVGPYDPLMGRGNPARSANLKSYLDFCVNEQKRAGVCARQASPLLEGAVKRLLVGMESRLDKLGEAAVVKKLELGMYRALFATALSCGRRGHGLSHIQIPRIIKLPDGSGLMVEALLSKTLREQKDCFGLRRQSVADRAICPVTLIEQWVDLATPMGFDMTRGWLFFNFAWPAWGKRYLDPRVMMQRLRSFILEVGMEEAALAKSTMHGFRVGMVITKLLAGEELGRIMRDAAWKKQSTVAAYAKLYHVL
ncbi:unnamed protein product, partial [Heterosigma akashiwo]